jgi:hypothetical protein
MVRQLLYSLAFAVVVAAAVGCKIPSISAKPSVTGTGALKSETREVAAFKELGIEGPFTVVVKVGPARSLKIEAQENLLPKITSVVKDQRLLISSDFQLESSEPIRITITTPTLTAADGAGAASLHVEGITGKSFSSDLSGASKLKAAGSADAIRLAGSGAAEIVWDGLRANKIVVEASGGSSMLLSGNANRLELGMSGGSTFKGEGLAAKGVSVESSGGSEVVVKAADALSVMASGGGRVRYIGSPKVTTEISGGTDVRQMP